MCNEYFRGQRNSTLGAFRRKKVLVILLVDISFCGTIAVVINPFLNSITCVRVAHKTHYESNAVGAFGALLVVSILGLGFRIIRCYKVSIVLLIFCYWCFFLQG